MELLKAFFKKHLKKIILGVILCIITFGIYGLFKVYKTQKGS